MRIDDGYKMTEVGVIPKDWEVVSFGDIVEYIKGFAFKSTDYCTDGIRIIRISDTTYDSIKDDNAIYINVNSYIKHRKWELLESDLVFSTVGSKPPMYDSLVGKVILITKKYAGSLLNQNAVLIRNKEKNMYLQRLLLNHFRTKRYVKYIETIFRGNANQASITLADLFKFPIPLPPSKDEQTAISTALYDVDELMQSLEKLIDKKRAIRQGAMQELLTGKRRLQEYAKKNEEYKRTEVGIIPVDWDNISMGEVGQIIIGLTYSPSNVKEYGTLVLRSSNVQNGKLAFDDNVYVDMELPSRVIVKKDDILICVRNGSRQLIGKCALIDEKAEDSAFGAFMSLYRSQYSKFIYYQFQTNIIQKQIDEVMGATINQITNKDLSTFKIALPKEIDEQRAIVKVLSDMDAEITALEAKLEKYKKIKQGMIQNLLTGKIRLI